MRVGEARGHGYLSRREERFHEFSRIERVPERVSCGDVFTIATRDATRSPGLWAVLLYPDRKKRPENRTIVKHEKKRHAENYEHLQAMENS